MAGKIFINYRRGDDPGNTGRLFDRLQEAFAPEQLFMDVDNIAPGLDFVRVLEEQVGQCDALLAVIGKGWIDARDDKGGRRLDNPEDFVRIEIESALKQDKRVIPVLVGDTHMPRPEELPEAIRPLARRNAVRLSHERFRADAQGLIKALQQALEEVEALRQAHADAERKRQEDAANARAQAQREAEEQARRVVEPSPEDWEHQKPEVIKQYYAQTESDFFGIVNDYLSQANLAAGLYRTFSRSHRRWRFFEKFVPRGMASTSMNRGEQAAEFRKTRDLLLSRYREYSSNWVYYVEAYGKTPTACINAGRLYRQLVDSDQELRQRINQLTEVSTPSRLR